MHIGLVFVIKEANNEYEAIADFIKENGRQVQAGAKATILSEQDFDQVRSLIKRLGTSINFC